MKPLPCPFCGQTVMNFKKSNGPYGVFAWIECPGCGARTASQKCVIQDESDPNFYNQSTYNKLKTLWNMRCNNGE